MQSQAQLSAQTQATTQTRLQPTGNTIHTVHAVHTALPLNLPELPSVWYLWHPSLSRTVSVPPDKWGRLAPHLYALPKQKMGWQDHWKSILFLHCIKPPIWRSARRNSPKPFKLIHTSELSSAWFSECIFAANLYFRNFILRFNTFFVSLRRRIARVIALLCLPFAAPKLSILHRPCIPF